MKSFKIWVLAVVLLTTANMAFSQIDTVKTATIKVKGVTCANDLKTIASNVEKLKGVNSCKPAKPGATTKFEVTFNPALVTEKEIYAVIEDTEGCKNPNDRPYKVKQ